MAMERKAYIHSIFQKETPVTRLVEESIREAGHVNRYILLYISRRIQVNDAKKGKVIDGGEHARTCISL